jgi:broad specificity phosphatase PhoE
MAKEIELRRHTDSDRDVLTQEGVQEALELGKALRGGYRLLVSSGAQRATQTLACFACALGERVPGGAVVESGMRSEARTPGARLIRRLAAANSAHCGRPIRAGR